MLRTKTSDDTLVGEMSSATAVATGGRWVVASQFVVRLQQNLKVKHLNHL